MKTGWCESVIAINKNYQTEWKEKDKVNAEIARQRRQTCEPTTSEHYDINNFIPACNKSKCEAIFTRNNHADISIWQTYRNEEFGFEARYPAHWKFFDASLEGGYDSKGYSGEDGFFQYQAIEDEVSVDIDELSQYEAYFDKPYGSKPVIKKLKIEGQEARLILPSEDQSKDMRNRAALVIRYPKPIFIQESTYGYLILLVDKGDIDQILSTFRFIE